MTNVPGDRHVLAAAVRSHAGLIVTYNRRHFPAESIRPWEIEVQGPSTFLRGLYDLEAGLFVRKLHEQAEAIGAPLGALLGSLAKAASQRMFPHSSSTFVKSKESGLRHNGEQAGIAGVEAMNAAPPPSNPVFTVVDSSVPRGPRLPRPALAPRTPRAK